MSRTAYRASDMPEIGSGSSSPVGLSRVVVFATNHQARLLWFVNQETRYAGQRVVGPPCGEQFDLAPLFCYAVRQQRFRSLQQLLQPQFEQAISQCLLDYLTSTYQLSPQQRASLSSRLQHPLEIYPGPDALPGFVLDYCQQPLTPTLTKDIAVVVTTELLAENILD